MCLPLRGNQLIVALARAEAKLAAAVEARRTLTGVLHECERRAAAGDASDAVRLEQAKRDLQEAESREAEARGRVQEATLDKAKADELLESDRRKGVRCVTKGQRASELHEKPQAREREERLTVFNECLNGTTVQKLQVKVGGCWRARGLLMSGGRGKSRRTRRMVCTTMLRINSMT